jgi:hypothetical protein
MDVLDLSSLTQARNYFEGIQRPCPSNLCDGFLSEFEVETQDPFKAFLMCPKCESRLRVHRREKGVGNG